MSWSARHQRLSTTSGAGLICGGPASQRLERDICLTCRNPNPSTKRCYSRKVYNESQVFERPGNKQGGSSDSHDPETLAGNSVRGGYCWCGGNCSPGCPCNPEARGSAQRGRGRSQDGPHSGECQVLRRGSSAGYCPDLSSHRHQDCQAVRPCDSCGDHHNRCAHGISRDVES